MKTEILRIHSLNYKYAHALFLEDISLCLLQGEVTGFLGLSYSGKDELVSILSGEDGGLSGRQDIEVCGKRIRNASEMRDAVYKLRPENYMIDNWTVAEYIGLTGKRWPEVFLRSNKAAKEIADYFSELGVHMDVSRRLSELTELEKRIADVVKARWSKKKVLIIEDEFEGMDISAMIEFRIILSSLCRDALTVIVSSHSDMVVNVLSDRFIIFRNGKIVKKCKAKDIEGKKQLERFLLGNEFEKKKRGLEQYPLNRKEYQEIVYRISNIPFDGGKRREFAFFRGEVASLLMLDSRQKERLFYIISGRRPEPGILYRIQSGTLNADEYEEFARARIVSDKQVGNGAELFGNLTALENYLMPSLKKMTEREYMASYAGVRRMVQGEMEELEAKRVVNELQVNDLIRVSLSRWLMYHPRALVLLEPFVNCDAYSIALVQSIIKMLANSGTAVIIIKSRDEYVTEISNRILRLDTD